ncbi:hypothetical protein RXV86_19790 [Alisedimentitalea sp. MJ-SS2]|uniref:hypothetical protein n=1 Tax=Aliisedimentitalea sp. MJ-SS2 TaxID=3049795 RepID=UPI0029147D29|nr:hypothetical protein [Alisedimentitalea sp. MJ-SS2]MDU8929635.1 hypothetical protein [Alisedimentitalea sp. MJ-SS2]
MWNQRYAGEAYAYGTEPNDFLRERAVTFAVGDTLCLAEGEGRQAIFLAGLGHHVSALDAAETGHEQAHRVGTRSFRFSATCRRDCAPKCAGKSRMLCDRGQFILEAYTPR